MAVRVRLVPEGRVLEVDVRGGMLRVREILERVGLNPEAAVVLRDGRPLTEDEAVKDGESVDVVRVLSGGQV